MNRFIIRFVRFNLIAMIPIVLLLTAGFFYYDPFKLLKKYDDYSYHPNDINLNRDFISTEMYLRHKDKYQYNSFIFGSSRTMAFRPSSWKNHLPENASVFAYDAGIESVYGIHKKIKFLDKIHTKLDHVFILIDRDGSFNESENFGNYMFIKHPLLSGESKAMFYYAFMKNYFNPVFLFNYYTFKFTQEYKEWMHDVIINYTMTYDTITNETYMVTAENILHENEPKFYADRKDFFYERKGETIDSVNRIFGKNLEMLQEIKQILEKNKSDYKVVLSPVYDMVKFSPADQKILTDLFGNHLYDFTGKNLFTIPVTNYYETRHFRPQVGDSIFNIIYK